jgi:hypothetical protein
MFQCIILFKRQGNRKYDNRSPVKCQLAVSANGGLGNFQRAIGKVREAANRPASSLTRGLARGVLTANYGAAGMGGRAGSSGAESEIKGQRKIINNNESVNDTSIY